jgi:hypothetical protein
MIGKKFSKSRKEHKEHKGIKCCGRNAGGEREGIGIYKNGEKTASRTGKELGERME